MENHIMNTKNNDQLEKISKVKNLRESHNKQLDPLNFDIKEVSDKELEKTINEVQPAMNACGLCKLVIGSG